MTTLAWRSFSCPAVPIGSNRIWREYFSEFIGSLSVVNRRLPVLNPQFG
jgi:hypothetical protein